MIWLVYALLSAFCAALVVIFAKIGLATINPVLAATTRAVIMAGALLVTTFFTQNLNGHLFDLCCSRSGIFILLSGIMSGAAALFGLLALKYGTITDIAALEHTSILFVVIFSALIFGKALTLQTMLGALLIVGGAYLIILK